ncbi:hypothetical protein ACQEU3_16815 [Spirillospora sp. CA-253888]
MDYALTGLGASAVPLVEHVRDRADRHIAEVHTARTRYDAEATGDDR